VFDSELDRYPEEKHEFLFELMIKYELAYRDKHDEKRLIIPHLLQEDSPAVLPEMSPFETLSIRFTSDNVLPEHTISRFIVQNNEEIQRKDEKDVVWRYGVVLENKEGNIGLIEEKRNSIIVSVKGNKKTEYIQKIQKSLIAIFESYKTDMPDVEYQLMLHGTDKETSQLKTIWLKDKTIRNYLKNDRPYYDDEENSEYSIEKSAKEYGIEKERNIVKNTFNGPVEIHGHGAFSEGSTFNITEYHDRNIELQGTLNNLIDMLKENKHQEEAAEIEGIVKAVDNISNLKEPNAIKKSGVMNRVKQFLEDLTDENSSLNKKLNQIKGGVKLIKNLVIAYNVIAPMFGGSPVLLEFLD
jgi:hypothetical protein